MTAVNILYKNPSDKRITSSNSLPACCSDLNLDQVFAAVAGFKPGYKLERVFNEMLTDIDDVRYRQDVFRDLQEAKLEDALLTYSAGMLSVNRMLESLEKIVSGQHKRSWFLEAALQYCAACEKLDTVLADATLLSESLRKLREHARAYVRSQAYIEFSEAARSIRGQLDQICFTTTVKNLTITVSKYEEEMDYGKAIEETFSRFSQGEGKSYLVSYSKTAGMNHIQAQILDGVAKLWPDTFDELAAFCEKHESFIDETLDTFAKDIQFYLSWLYFMHDLETKGYVFCIPELQEGHEESKAFDMFDIALARKQESKIVVNDFHLDAGEHIIVVTGPNQGGKTTFARSFGQIHYLAALGCPVPGRDAKLMLPDEIFTHFEREESLKTHHGKLYEELIRMHDCLGKTTARSLLILNEVFSSTTVQDSLMLSEKIMRKIILLRTCSVWVTFLHELSDMDPSIVSMAGQIVPDNPSMRTFRITRKPADDLAYARALAEKHGLSYKQLIARIQK